VDGLDLAHTRESTASKATGLIASLFDSKRIGMAALSLFPSFPFFNLLFLLASFFSPSLVLSLCLWSLFPFNRLWVLLVAISFAYSGRSVNSYY
jgi:hypothetical protein